VAEETALDLKALNVYLVEGVVEVDPLDDRPTIRTQDQQGNPISFDPIPVLHALKGQEVRVVITPLASITTLEEHVKSLPSEGEPVVLVDPRKFDSN
jgi:hypothetical protein